MSGNNNADRDPADPRVVAGYRLLRRIGEGGMSTVYLSYDVPGRRAVAVKLLADHLAGQAEFVNRFYREAHLSQKLHHPTIVQGLAQGFDPAAGKHYLVLEFIDGPSAHAALTRMGKLPVGMAVRIGIDIARALEFLHAKNYVHRDVKPDNILLHPDGMAKLADLGLTKRLSDESHLTSVNQGVGTTYYMPYEQAVNATLVDGRSDVFALGATLYHLLTGQVPFPGSTHEEVIREKEHDLFRPLRAACPGAPEELETIIAKTLARNPRERFQTAAELADALEDTGLATRLLTIPAASPDVTPTAPEASIETPTRVDHPVGSDGSNPPRPGPGGKIVPFLITVSLILLGLLGAHSRTPASPLSECGCEVVEKERPANAAECQPN
jgi:serine/threonine protein kinase